MNNFDCLCDQIERCLRDWGILIIGCISKGIFRDFRYREFSFNKLVDLLMNLEIEESIR